MYHYIYLLSGHGGIAANFLPYSSSSDISEMCDDASELSLISESGSYGSIYRRSGCTVMVGVI